MGKRAEYAVPRNSSRDGRVLIHVQVIVEIDEIVPQRLTKNEPSDCNQNQADIQRREAFGRLDSALLRPVLVPSHVNQSP